MANFGTEVFTGTAGTELSVYNTSWIRAPSFVVTAVLSTAGDLRCTGTGTGAYLWNGGTPATADYTVAADLVCYTVVASAQAGVSGRADSVANTSYTFKHISGTGWRLQKTVAGTTTTLGTAGAVNLNAGQTYRITLSMVGTTIKGNVDGTDLISVTDSAIAAAGLAGVQTANASSNAAGVHIDNWTADDFVADLPFAQICL